MNRNLRLSVAIPIHNEESVLPELLRRVGRVLDDLEGGPHEIVLVDDGSSAFHFQGISAIKRQ
jgi:glycosyltransferase involved in cell wall biosynthesis